MEATEGRKKEKRVKDGREGGRKLNELEKRKQKEEGEVKEWRRDGRKGN